MKLNGLVRIPKLLVYLASAAILLGFLAEANAFDGQTSSENRVRVDVKPVQLAAGKPAVFEIRLNTHSVNLDYDLVRLSTLQDDQGRAYEAVDWKGAPPGGHHRSGTLEFPQLEGSPRSIKLIIRDISGVPKRSFEWKIQG